MTAGTRLGVDVGGTFTDLVWIGAGQVRTVKVLSTPNPEQGVFAAMAEIGIVPGSDPGIAVFSHGMTVATNALLERKGVPTLFLTTAGFRDVLAIGRQNRPALYDLTQPKPDPVVGRQACIEVRERASVAGVIEPLTDAEVERVLALLAARIPAEGIEAVAIGLLFSFLYPEHELRLGQAIRERFSGIHVSLSCQTAPEMREYERFSTTVIDAYLGPKLAGYLWRLASGCAERGLPDPLIMQSSGGVGRVHQVAEHASVALLSGPAGGVYGAAFVGKQSGFLQLLTFDMGGTSTDVALIQDGLPQTTGSAVVCGFPILQPQIDIHTVSAGGGSLAAVVAGGTLQVGPHSAGSRPGPACYGHGGISPTVTDANLWLGYLSDRIGSSLRLQRSLAERALATVAEPLGLTVAETAVGIRTLANAHMVRALRVISVERGLDPTDFALLAFGGAGPMHACALAESLGIGTVLIPAESGVLSALGMALSDLRRDYRQAILQPLKQEGWRDPLAALVAQAQQELTDPALSPSLDLRYRGQSFDLSIPVGPSSNPRSLAVDFHQTHQQRYGWNDPERAIEILNVRLSAIQVMPPSALQASAINSDPVISERSAWMGDAFVTVPVYQRLGNGSEVAGPAIVQMSGSTAVIERGWQGRVDERGTLVLRFASRCEDPAPPDP